MNIKGVLIALILTVTIWISQADAESLVVKVIAVNPSKEENQKAEVKTYLPKEIKPDDVLDRGDLDLAYDTQQGSYFVFGEYELTPGEVLEREIELKDIWTIPETEIESLRSEANKLQDLLKNTEFMDRIAFLKEGIESKLNQIVESQKNPPPNPERHISDHRENLKILEAVKTDLTLARSLLSQAKPLPTSVVWRLILAIIGFLAVLGGSFYFIWQRQSKVIFQDPFGATESEKDESKQKSETT